MSSSGFELKVDHAREGLQHPIETPSFGFEKFQRVNYGFDRRDALEARLFADPVLARLFGMEGELRQIVERGNVPVERASLMPGAIENDQRIRPLRSRDFRKISRSRPRIEQRRPLRNLEWPRPISQSAIVVDGDAYIAEAAFGDAGGSKRMEPLMGMLDDQQGRAIVDRYQVAAEAQRAGSKAGETNGPRLGLGLCGV